MVGIGRGCGTLLLGWATLGLGYSAIVFLAQGFRGRVGLASSSVLSLYAMYWGMRAWSTGLSVLGLLENGRCRQ